MYEFLEGQVAGRTAARLVLEVQGVGYDIAVPLLAHFAGQGRVRVWTHFVVREDSQQLFGFPDAASRDLFRALLSVRGVGPSVGLALLSGLAREDLVEALASGDAKRLCSVKGVGKKTADQILLDLGGKAQELAASLGIALGTQSKAVLKPRRGSQAFGDAVAALVSIGYGEGEAKKAVERALRTVDSQDLELLVRTAIQAGAQ